MGKKGRKRRGERENNAQVAISDAHGERDERVTR